MTQANAQNAFTTDVPAPEPEFRSYTQLQTLHEISQTILESQELGVMMDRILETTLEHGKFDIGMIRLLQADNSLEPVTSRGYREAANVERQRKRAGDPSSPRVIAQVLESKETKVEDLAQVDGMRTFKREGVSTMVTVPLRTQHDVLGVLHLGSRSQRKVERHEIRLLEAIGTQTGIAIQKIRLFEAAERQAKEQQTLNAIATATSQSLDLKELFEIAADKLVEVTGRQRINFRLMDPVTAQVSVVTYRGFTADEIEVLRRISFHPRVEQVFASGKPLVINADARSSETVLLAQTQSVAWIPIQTRGRVVGIIGISDDQARTFSPAEVELLMAIGNVIGVAIENARLFGETKRNLEKIRTLNDISTTINATLDLAEMLELFLQKIVRSLPYAASTIRLLNVASGILEPTACCPIDASKWRAESRQGGGGLAHQVFATKTPLRVANVQTDPRVRDAAFFREHGLVSYVGVPLIVRDELFGVLSFFTSEPREFADEEVEFLSTLAGQAAIAIHNSQLYEQTRKQAVELEQSNQAKDELLDVMVRQKQELAELNAGLQREIAERTKARAEIAAKNRDLETLLYVTSHDLREPLRAIENFSRIVHERYRDSLDEKGQDFMRRVIIGAQRLNRLLDDILMLSRSQRMGSPTEQVGGELIVQEALRRLDDKIRLTQARVHVAGGFDELRVDKTWATQAVYNLVANALKFTSNGEPPDIDITPYRPDGPAGRAVGITVRDRGPGVAPEHAERIFQLFQRAVGREVEGTGAGLAIVRQIAERHGGTAWVKPREGGGSEFIITFGKKTDGGGDSQ